MVTRKRVEAVLKKEGLRRAKLGWNNGTWHVTEGYELVDPDVGDWTLAYTMSQTLGLREWSGSGAYLNLRLHSIKEWLTKAGIDATIEQDRIIIRRDGGQE